MAYKDIYAAAKERADAQTQANIARTYGGTPEQMEGGLTPRQRGAEQRLSRQARREEYEQAALAGVDTAEEALAAQKKVASATTGKVLGQLPTGEGGLRQAADIQAGVERDTAGDVALAAQAVNEEKMKGLKLIEEAGSEIEDLAAARTEATTAMNTIIAKHKGFWNDDENAMYREIMAYLEDPTIPPEIVVEFTQKAKDILSKKWDV